MKKILFAFLFLSPTVKAQLVNGALDNNFNGWQIIGNGYSDSAAIGGYGPQPFLVTMFGSNAFPQFGVQMVQLATGGTADVTAMESFANVNPGTLHNLQTVLPPLTFTPTFGGAIRQKFYGTANSVLSIQALFSTTEPIPNWDTLNWTSQAFIYNDFAFFTVTSATTQYSALVSDLKSLWIDQSIFLGYTDMGHHYFNHWVNMQYTLPATDSFTVTIGIMNSGDNTVTSDLLVDNATLTNPTSVANNFSDNDNILFFPNPSSEFISIAPQSEKTIFKLYSAEGILVKSEYLERNSSSTIDVSTIANGFYLFTLSEVGGKTKSGHLVIAH